MADPEDPEDPEDPADLEALEALVLGPTLNSLLALVDPQVPRPATPRVVVLSRLLLLTPSPHQLALEQTSQNRLRLLDRLSRLRMQSRLAKWVDSPRPPQPRRSSRNRQWRRLSQQLRAPVLTDRPLKRAMPSLPLLVPGTTASLL
jgi:hypothetical protein